MAPLGPKHQRSWLLDTCAIFVLCVALIFPLFRLNYLNNWKSIEATFIAGARLLRENWPHHLWQPLWYLGTRTDYVYPPGLRFGVAMFSWLLHASFAHAYHIFIALFYASGMVCVYLWVRTATGSRGAAWLAAAGVALGSPCFLVAPELRADSRFYVPWRLHVLMTYGEGPHISSLAILPMAWLGAWRRLHGGGVRWLLVAACAAAFVVTLNFYGATSLAITYPLLVWACFLEQPSWRVIGNSVLIPALAYGLTAWWLTPSYLQITLGNLHLVAPQSRASSDWELVFILIAYLIASLAIRRTRFSAYPFFVWSTWLFLSLYIFGYRWFGFEVAGDTQRLVAEWDLFAIICAVTLASRAWNWNLAGRLALAPRIAMAFVIALCFFPSASYLEHAYSEFQPDPHWQDRVEYQTQDWLWRNFPRQRVYVSGSERFWYNVWHDGLQGDGGSNQGILHPLIESMQWRLLHDVRPEIMRDWLQATGIDIVVVPGATSKEPYKDFTNGAVYDHNFPLFYADGAGNRYYRVPRREPGIVQIVDRSKLAAAPAIPLNYEAAEIAVYADAVQAVPPGGDASGRLQAHWVGSDQLDIQTDAKPGETLLVQESFDPNWHALVDGRPQAIWRDAAGLMALDLPPGEHSVRFRFETPREIIGGRIATCLTLILCIALGLRRKRLLDQSESRSRDAFE